MFVRCLDLCHHLWDLSSSSWGRLDILIWLRSLFWSRHVFAETKGSEHGKVPPGSYWRLYNDIVRTLENIVHFISRGRIVTRWWNLVCVCNKYQWWYSDLNIPGNSKQTRFSEFSIFLWNLIILNPELRWFLFSDRLQLLHSFPELCTHS